MTRSFGMRTLLLASVLGAAAPLAAAPINFADNLDCRKLKDSAPPSRYTVDVTSNTFGLAAGCTIKVPAKLLCTGAIMDAMNPPGLVVPAGVNVNDRFFLCYKAKCPTSEAQFILTDTLGGSRVVSVRQTKMVCTPAS